MNSLFIFRLDLRLQDNIGLIECLKNSKKVYICFIFDPKQIDKRKNSYFSDNCVQFMIESLKELYHESKNEDYWVRMERDKIGKLMMREISPAARENVSISLLYPEIDNR